MALLEINDQNTPVTRVELQDPTVIGRMNDCTIQLREPHASRRHAEIFTRADGWYIIDLDTRNGTLVNGEQVHERRLLPGDVVTIGKATLTFLDQPPPRAHNGEMLGDYDVLEEIARSPHARVCRVSKPSSGRQMVMKIFDRSAFGAGMDNVLGAARSLALVTHPAVAAIYEVNPQGDHPYVVSEFVQGRTLAEVIAAEGRMLPDRAKSVIVHAAEGLLVAHSRGVAHGNLKPRNILIGLAGEVKLVDFGGMCRGDAGPSRVSTVAGIPYYVAPEQILGNPADHRSDIYSLGAIFYCMLAGVPMFTGRSNDEIMQKHLREKPEDLARVVPGLPIDLCRVIERMVAKEPVARFQSAQELINALTTRAMPVMPTMPAVAEAPKAEKETEAASFSPVLAFAAGIAIILLLVATFLGGRDLGQILKKAASQTGAVSVEDEREP